MVKLLDLPTEGELAYSTHLIAGGRDLGCVEMICWVFFKVVVVVGGGEVGLKGGEGAAARTPLQVGGTRGACGHKPTVVWDAFVG
jgi:hypothetical protein